MSNDAKELRWDTPVSDAGSLAMVSLLDQDGLHITLRDLRDPTRRRYRFTFREVAAYRNILEEYRLSEPPVPEGTGWTRLFSQSPWLRELRQREPLLDVHTPNCQHYVIVTEDDVVDILSPIAPEIREVEPALPEDRSPGKSRILYHPEDRGQIDELFDGIKNDIRKRRKQDA